MKRPLALCLAVTLAITSGCATVFNETMQPVLVQSTTPGAQIVVDGMAVGVTPSQVLIDTHRDHVIQVIGAGGRQFVCQVRTGAGVVWIVLDIVLGLLPLIVDAITGDWGEADSTCFAPV